MQQKISIQVTPAEADDLHLLHDFAAKACAVPKNRVQGVTIIKKSIDARSRQVRINLTLTVFIDEPVQEGEPLPLQLTDVTNASRQALVIGAGPAGLFAALRLIELGIQPILLERGKDVRARRRDLAAINKEGRMNPESNYCFGEGGAGTYSDGKLYTRSTKRGDVYRILSILVQFGADRRILFETHPHIGTNKLPQIITAMREQIIACGGQVHFEQKVTDLKVEEGMVKGVMTTAGEWPASSVVLATGHSARDVFELLHRKRIAIESKPFALGVRVEHPQSLIDNIQYHSAPRGEHLPPASYSLVQQVGGKGVFSFCMCPGGIIAPAATDEDEIVVNGWSPSKRNNPYANSGIVVSVDEENMKPFGKYGPLAGMQFQKSVEQQCFIAGGGKLVAPAQRLVDFCTGKNSSSLPDCSYLPGIHPVPLKTALPEFVYHSLQSAFLAFGKKMKGYYTNEAVVVATESRTSSPVRIPRNALLQHPGVKGLYPCGEGAGYAGGIVSAAMDGERVANALAAS
jgi:uncharacterized FAD-dependent dehydrogenase